MAATLALIWAMSEGGMFFTSCWARHLEMDKRSDGPLCSPHPSPSLVLPPRTYLNALSCPFTHWRPSLSVWHWLPYVSPPPLPF